jgi:hypothetical protein
MKLPPLHGRIVHKLNLSYRVLETVDQRSVRALVENLQTGAYRYESNEIKLFSNIHFHITWYMISLIFGGIFN